MDYPATSGNPVSPAESTPTLPRGWISAQGHFGAISCCSWVRAPSLTSGLSSFPPTPDARLDGFIAEARGTCQTTNTVHVSQCVAGISGPLSMQASSASGVGKSKNPLFKLQRYDGSASLKTFILQFKHLATYLQWSEEDHFYHMCASLDGPAGQVFGSCRHRRRQPT